jgi:hypothetical protein
MRLPLLVHVPTKLKIGRTADTLSIGIETNSFESTNITVGTNMVTGIRYELYVYRLGETRPVNGEIGMESGMVFNSGVRYWQTESGHIPLNPMSQKQYVVELDLAAFETDIPPQHDWSPLGSKNYKVLWQRTLRQTVE